ncbi:MAG: hypothetical protein K2J32_03570 [Ruminococcus sp.]|nr:hypothetical protein [Ruminococcus sp.]
MYERKYADSYDMNLEKLNDIIQSHILFKENVSYSTEEDNKRIDALYDRINNIMALDEEFKRKFCDDLQNTMFYVSESSFSNGLRIGLSLLKQLLTAEMPEIHVVHHITNKTERRCKPVQKPSEIDEVFIDYTKKILPYLTDSQKMILQSGIEAMVEENSEKLHSIF